MGEVTFDLFSMCAYIKRELGHSQFELSIYPNSDLGPGYRIVIRDYSDVTKGISFIVTEAEIISGIPDILNLKLDCALEDLKR